MRKRYVEKLMQARAALVLTLLLPMVWVAACTVGKNPVTGNRRAVGYSWEEEIKMGKQAHQQIQQVYGFYTEGDIDEYVRRIGQRVLQESHMRRPETDEQFRNTEFTFQVLDSDTPNAFALPGGYVYVTRGLVSRLNNEAQLAVVLGHEIGHVAARHASQQAFEQQAGQIGLIAGAILGQEALGVPAQSILNLGGTATQLLFLQYSRSDERESDELGVEYAALAGYEAAEGAEFFNSLERIQEQQGQAVPGFLSTHPDPGNREERIVELAKKWAPKTEMNMVNKEDFYQNVDGMVIGSNPRQGFVESNTFFHPELRFRFSVPRNFQVRNSTSQVAMVGSNQQAVMVFTFAQANSAQAAASNFANQQGIQVRERGATSSNGIQAYALVADAQTQQQQVRLLAYFLEYRGNVYQFVGYTSPQQFSQYQDLFLQTARSFQEVSDRRILDVQPVRLNVQRASRTAPFRAFLDNAPFELADLNEQDLAILNQVELDTQIEEGTLLKLPRR